MIDAGRTRVLPSPSMAEMLFVRASTEAQHECLRQIAGVAHRPHELELLRAFARLVAEVGAEGATPNGVYRVKLQGREITLSFERFHGSVTRTLATPAE
jgi:hypothetical protein